MSPALHRHPPLLQARSSRPGDRRARIPFARERCIAGDQPRGEPGARCVSGASGADRVARDERILVMMPIDNPSHASAAGNTARVAGTVRSAVIGIVAVPMTMPRPPAPGFRSASSAADTCSFTKIRRSNASIRARRGNRELRVGELAGVVRRSTT